MACKLTRDMSPAHSALVFPSARGSWSQEAGHPGSTQAVQGRRHPSPIRAHGENPHHSHNYIGGYRKGAVPNASTEVGKKF